MFRCEVTSDAGEFWRRAEPFLTADPVVYSVPLTLTIQRRERAVVDPAPPTFATVVDAAGDVVGVALRTPPRNAYVSRLPVEAVPVVVDTFREVCPDLPGVNGTAEDAGRFADLWCARTGLASTVEMRQRIHRLDTLTVPAGVPGECRAAGPGERDLLLAWSLAFGEEADPMGDEAAVAADVDLRLRERRAYLWLAGGEPVSYTGHTPAVAGVTRVGPVYTPVERRRRGYAGALVADVSRRLLDAGSAVCLYTDLANPTSNKIYAEVGYRPLCDVTVYRFG